jgi:type I restriction enzyme S subunit
MDNYRTDLTFKDVDEGWATARLGDVCEINPSAKEIPDRFIYVDLESVVDGQLLKEKKISKENAPSRAQRVLEKNDILFQMVRPYQKNNLFFDKDGFYVASTGYAQIRTKLSARFFYHLFHTDTFVYEVLKKCTGSNYPAINSSDLSNLIIHYPLSIIHSTKIASCLSSLDEVIAAHSQKLALLKDHKKGLMQNLFPQEGEKVPKYRFKEFEKDGEWVESSIEQIAKVTTGNKDTQNKVDDGKYPFFVRSQTIERINSFSFDLISSKWHLIGFFLISGKFVSDFILIFIFNVFIYSFNNSFIGMIIFCRILFVIFDIISLINFCFSVSLLFSSDDIS